MIHCFSFFALVPVFAADSKDVLVIIPEAEEDFGKKVEELGKQEWGDFFDKYDAAAKDLEGDVGAQIGSGIMNRNTIIALLGNIVKFVANAALIVGAAMVIYAWYLYVASAFSGDHTWKANDAIKYAVMGIVVVIFSYAILRFAIQAFL